MRVPLIDGQGNYGSIDGDPPAACTLHESRLAKVAHELIEDIGQGHRRFQASLRRFGPGTARVAGPVSQSLVNGSGGIAVGMATNIPPTIWAGSRHWRDRADR